MSNSGLPSHSPFAVLWDFSACLILGVHPRDLGHPARRYINKWSETGNDFRESEAKWRDLWRSSIYAILEALKGMPGVPSSRNRGSGKRSLLEWVARVGNQGRKQGMPDCFHSRAYPGDQGCTNLLFTRTQERWKRYNVKKTRPAGLLGGNRSNHAQDLCLDSIGLLSFRHDGYCPGAAEESRPMGADHSYDFSAVSVPSGRARRPSESPHDHHADLPDAGDD